MAVTKILFNPGINKEFTELMDKGGWADGNLVRFRKRITRKSWRLGKNNQFFLCGYR